MARKFGLDHTVTSKGSEEEGFKKQPAFLQSVRQPASSYNYDSGDEDDLNSVEELEKRIDSLHHCLEAKQCAIEECSFRLSGIFLGQDRFYRNYFVLGSVGGIYIEGQPISAREGSASRGIPSVFDPDAICAEIKARRELAVMRHFNTNPSSSSSSATMAQKSNSLRPTPVSIPPSIKVENLTQDVEKHENEEAGIKECEEKVEIENPPVIRAIPSDSPREDLNQIVKEEVTPAKEEKSDANLKEEGGGEEIVFLTSSDKKSEKMEEPEEPTIWQPLDLSTKRATPPPTTISPHPSKEFDLSLWQSLTEHDLASALSACQLDDTFLTTATLLFASQADAIDRPRAVGGWTDPNWHIQLLFYKLQLIRSVAYERRKNSENDDNALSTSLRQLKTWLEESYLENEDVRHSLNSAKANELEMDGEELGEEVERILVEKGIQGSASEATEMIPSEMKGNWWRAKGSEGLRILLGSLLPRGIRERALAQSIQLAEQAIASSVHVDASAGE